MKSRIILDRHYIQKTENNIGAAPKNDNKYGNIYLLLKGNSCGPSSFYNVTDLKKKCQYCPHSLNFKKK